MPFVQPSTKPPLRQLLRTTEGRVLLVGIVVALGGVIVLGSVAFWSPQTSRMMGIMSVSNIVFGRAMSMSIGYAGGYGHSIVVPVNMWVETVLVLLFYPVFVLTMRKLVTFPRLGRIMRQTQQAAEQHHAKVRRYGIVGLFAFVWLPFWMTGPVVGSAIGYLLGLPAWLTLTVVLIGTYVAMGGWAYLLFDLYTRTSAFGPWAPVVIIGLVLLLSMAGYLLSRRGARQRREPSR